MKELPKYRHVQGMTIQVQDNDFAQGYTEGYNHFLAHPSTTMSDEQITCFIEQAMSCPLSRRSNAGYVTGWLAALRSTTTRGPISQPVAQRQRVIRRQSNGIPALQPIKVRSC